MVGLLYRLVPPIAGGFGWYGMTILVQDAVPITEHADWVIGIMGVIITFCLGIIGFFSSKSIARIERDIADMRKEIHCIGEKVAGHTVAISDINNRRKK